MALRLKRPTWSGLCDQKRRDKALVYSLAAAERMCDPQIVKSAVLNERNQSLVNRILPWDDVTLSHGYPALILLFSELDRQNPADGWDLIAHKYLLELKEIVDKKGIHSISLFGGLAGMAFATFAASRNETRYTRLLAHFNSMLIRATMEYLEAANHELSMGKGVSSGMYDVIQGLSGVGRYFLAMCHNEQMCMVLREILAYFIKVTYPISIDGKTVSGWFIPRDSQLIERDKELYPKGNFNCGLAHGIPGPLALLSLAIKNHIEIDGQREAILRIAEWLIDARQDDEYGPFWFDRVSFDEQPNLNTNLIFMKREAWCYGTPGVARALYLAGDAVENDDLCKMGMQSFHAVFSRPEKTWKCYSPTFCHGFSGLLAMTARMSADTKDARFQHGLSYLVDKLVTFYDSQNPLGFRDIEIMHGNSREIDKAGLLEGSTGVALALHSMCCDEEPVWDNAFLIS